MNSAQELLHRGWCFAPDDGGGGSGASGASQVDDSQGTDLEFLDPNADDDDGDGVGDVGRSDAAAGSGRELQFGADDDRTGLLDEDEDAGGAEDEDAGKDGKAADAGGAAEAKSFERSAVVYRLGSRDVTGAEVETIVERGMHYKRLAEQYQAAAEAARAGAKKDGGGEEENRPLTLAEIRQLPAEEQTEAFLDRQQWLEDQQAERAKTDQAEAERRGQQEQQQVAIDNLVQHTARTPIMQGYARSLAALAKDRNDPAIGKLAERLGQAATGLRILSEPIAGHESPESATVRASEIFQELITALVDAEVLQRTKNAAAPRGAGRGGSSGGGGAGRRPKGQGTRPLRANAGFQDLAEWADDMLKG